MRPLQIANHEIGNGRCFIIAEAGVNHNGDVDLACRLIDRAAEAEADAVKFQTFDPELLVSPDARQADYQAANTGKAESQLAMLRRLTLSHEAVGVAKEHAAQRGIIFLSTAFDESSADFLEQLGVAAFKIASGEITNHPLLAHVARKGRPLLLSTGMSTLDEVASAVGIVRANGNPPLALFHCVTNYPAAAIESNLRAMDTMREAFGVPVGWSDHTNGITIGLAAVARGAALLEKHFTLDRSLPGPDHAASIEPEELRDLVRAARDIEVAVGDGVKRPTPAELRIRPVVRRSLHLRRDLPGGHVLTADDVVALRPEGGIAPSALAAVVGQRLRERQSRGHLLRETDLG